MGLTRTTSLLELTKNNDCGVKEKDLCENADLGSLHGYA